MDDCDDPDALPTKSIDDAAISHNQLAYCLVLILRNDATQLGVSPKSLDGCDNASAHCRCVRSRVLADVFDDLSQIPLRT